MIFRKVTRRRIETKDEHGIPIRWVETLECGHTNSTGQKTPQNHLPCLTCEQNQTPRKP